MEIVEIRAGADDAEARVYEVRPGFFSRVFVRLAVGVGAALGLVILLPLLILGLVVALVVVVALSILGGVAWLRGRLIGDGRRNVRILR